MPREGHDIAHMHGSNAAQISIHVPREGHDLHRAVHKHGGNAISIHVPREGHDAEKAALIRGVLPISIHVPREGHDYFAGRYRKLRIAFQSTCPARGTTQSRIKTTAFSVFQSTCPARGTTGVEIEPLPVIRDFNPRAPRGARLQEREKAGHGHGISIHVPREGHDARMITAQSPSLPFQSTCPARGTTKS